MPRVTITFELPEEQHELDHALRGDEAASALWAIDRWCRDVNKHGEPSRETRQLADEIRNMIPPEFLDA